MTGSFADEFLTVFGATRVLEPSQILFACLLAFVLCSLLSAVYRWTYQGLSYSRAFVHTLILGGLISAILIMAIGNNLARGLGILGTLALIRFRTHIRDPRDIIFLFASFAIGIATGAAVFPVAIIGTLVFSLVALYLHWSPFASRREFEGLLRFLVEPNVVNENDVKTVLQKCCQSYELIAMREAAQGDLLEYSYHVHLLDPAYQSELLEGLRSLAGLSEPSLLMYRSTVEL